MSNTEASKYLSSKIEEEDKLANDNEKEAEKMLAAGKDKFPGAKKSENDTRKKEKGEDKK